MEVACETNMFWCPLSSGTDAARKQDLVQHLTLLRICSSVFSWHSFSSVVCPPTIILSSIYKLSCTQAIASPSLTENPLSHGVSSISLRTFKATWTSERKMSSCGSHSGKTTSSCESSLNCVTAVGWHSAGINSVFRSTIHLPRAWKKTKVSPSCDCNFSWKVLLLLWYDAWIVVQDSKTWSITFPLSAVFWSSWQSHIIAKSEAKANSVFVDSCLFSM